MASPAVVSLAPGEVAYIDSIAPYAFLPNYYRASVRTYTPAANNPYVKVTVSGSVCFHRDAYRNL